MTNFDRFIAENPNHPKVVSLIRLSNKPLSIHGSLGKRLVEVQQLAEEAYA